MSTYALLVAAISLLLTSCISSGSSKTPEINNPYILKAENHTSNGIEAMQQERWNAAERSFSRALSASQLADDTRLITRSWYNLATAYSGANDLTKAAAAYEQAIKLAQRNHDEVMHLRALLAMRLVQQRTGRLPENFSLLQLQQTLFSKRVWPSDLHLQAGRLAQRLGDSALAKSAYELVISLKESDRNSLMLKAEAHMGLALLSRDAGVTETAWSEAEQTLLYCRKIGAPRLTAHALLLQGELPPGNRAGQQDKLERALDIYKALNDLHGEKKALTHLLRQAEVDADSATAKLHRLRLKSIEDKLGEQH
ncbi:Tetratricopeptide repeat-containing protein [Mariprofundus aestuarium]|uniref:Tetratricopeptide repeat-containing protein n=1 Tax=Mariprofundus aestuarium TaxID=1921086 RepID=A0A2K8L3B4_MARES|nr:tetratricopeptide repeat protein [Mariprofundus aestuarium]ATX78736.1 Tetratricopeptide repeat-containing protein [Mariprofundus aestuarium]